MDRRGFHINGSVLIRKKTPNNARFRVIRAQLLSIQMFWDVTPSRLVNISRRFGRP
jgi:hypothetical protein